MFTLAHMSDIHLCPLASSSPVELLGKRLLGYLSWKWNREKIHSREALDLLVTDLNKQSHDHISITGDLINLSLPKEFLEAKDWLEALGAPERISVIPGNHDAYVKMPQNIGMQQWQSYMSNNAEGLKYAQNSASGFPYVRVFDKVAIIGLSTALPTPWFVHAGELGAYQIQSLEKILTSLSLEGMFRVILIHHPPILLPTRKQAQLGLWDVMPLRKVIEKTGAELILHGHHHADVRSSIPTHHGTVPVIGVPSASVAAHPTKPHARYNLYRIFQKDGNWCCELTGRGKRPDGREIVEIEKTMIVGS